MADYVEKILRLGLQNVHVGSEWVSSSCPWHEDNHPSFGVHRGTGGFSCFSCGCHGSWKRLLTLLGREEDTSVSGWYEKILSFSHPKGPSLTQEKVLPKSAPGYVPITESTPGYSPTLGYLLRRGIPKEDLIWAGCGYSTVFRHRAVLPSMSLAGEMEYWTARDIVGKSKLRYLTPKGGRPRGCLMNVARIRGISDRLVIAEGPISALAIGREATCTYSQAWTMDQAATVRSLAFPDVVVCFDGETRATELACQLCEALLSGQGEVRLCQLPAGRDPADLGREVMQGLIAQALPYDSLQVAAQRLLR